MMSGIHLDVQLYDKVCIFLKEVWQARSNWNILDCLILLLLLHKKIVKVFRACGGGGGSLVPLASERFTHNPMFKVVAL